MERRRREKGIGERGVKRPTESEKEMESRGKQTRHIC